MQRTEAEVLSHMSAWATSRNYQKEKSRQGEHNNKEPVTTKIKNTWIRNKLKVQAQSDFCRSLSRSSWTSSVASEHLVHIFTAHTDCGPPVSGCNSSSRLISFRFGCRCLIGARYFNLLLSDRPQSKSQSSEE